MDFGEKGDCDSFKPCVIVPVYNNCATLKKVVVGCRQEGLPVIVVDDGSTDGSGDTVRGMEGVEVVGTTKNYGKGNALRIGFKVAAERGFTHAVTCDADGQHNPACIGILLDTAVKNPKAIIVGRRGMKEGGAPAPNRFGRAFSNFWFNLLTGKDAGDVQSGFRVYPVEIANSLGTKWMKYEMEHEILVRGAWKGVDIVSVNIPVVYGDEIVSHFRKFRDSARFALLNASLVIERSRNAVGERSRNVVIDRSRLSASLGGRSDVEVKKTGERRGEDSWYVRETLGNRAGYEFFKYLYLTAGKGAAYAWLRVIANYYDIFAPEEAKSAAEAYLEKRFATRDKKMIRKWRREIIWQYAQTILDRLIIALNGFRDFEVLSDGFENIERVAKEGRGALLLGAHVGNFESGAMALLNKGISIRIVGVRKELEKVEKFIHSHYRGKGIPLNVLDISEDNFSYLKIYDALKDGELLAMLADRLWGDKTVTVRFLGKETKLPAGPFQISAMTGTPIVCWFVMKDSPQIYHLYAFGPYEVEHSKRSEREEVVKRLASWYVSNVEWILQRYPMQWYNFYDFWGEGINKK